MVQYQSAHASSVPQSDDTDANDNPTSIIIDDIIPIRNPNQSLSNQWVGTTNWFAVGDIIDVLDSTGHWCEAEVVKMDFQEAKIFVSFLYWDSKFDEWITNIEERTAPLHKHTYHEGGALAVGQRIYARDEKNAWMQAFVIDVNQSQVKVHYHNYHPKFDEWIDRDSGRIRPFNPSVKKQGRRLKLWRVPGYTSGANIVSTKYLTNDEDQRFIAGDENSHRLSASASQREFLHRNDGDAVEDNTRIRKVAALSTEYKHYLASLASQNLGVVSIPGDGNCLFRSVAHQVYGDDSLHNLVRQKCMDYMEADAEFFSQFIEGGMNMFYLYIRAKRLNGCWGDDPEIQAMCELYGRPADIWTFDEVNGSRKLRTFHESVTAGGTDLSSSSSSHIGRGKPPIRLSYYGGGHYDSIVGPDFRSIVASHPAPGVAEDVIIDHLKSRLLCSQSSSHGPSSSALSTSRPTTTATMNSSLSEAAVKAASDVDATDREALEFTLRLSRRDLDWANEDIESAFGTVAAHKHNGENIDGVLASSDVVATQKEILNQVVCDSEQEYIERAILSSLADESAAAEAQREMIELAKLQSTGAVSGSDSSISGSSRGTAAASLGTAVGNGLLQAEDDIEDPELALALKLSQLSEEEALEMALKQSLADSAVNQTQQRRASSSAAANIPSGREDWQDADNDLLQAAMAASIEQSTALMDDEDDDELLHRIIAESLR